VHRRRGPEQSSELGSATCSSAKMGRVGNYRLRRVPVQSCPECGRDNLCTIKERSGVKLTKRDRRLSGAAPRVIHHRSFTIASGASRTRCAAHRNCSPTSGACSLLTGALVDTQRCQGREQAAALRAFEQAKAYHDAARRLLIEGKTAVAAERIHNAMRRIATAAAYIAQNCAAGQQDIVPASLPVSPDDAAALEEGCSHGEESGLGDGCRWPRAAKSPCGPCPTVTPKFATWSFGWRSPGRLHAGDLRTLACRGRPAARPRPRTSWSPPRTARSPGSTRAGPKVRRRSSSSPTRASSSCSVASSRGRIKNGTARPVTKLNAEASSDASSAATECCTSRPMRRVRVALRILAGGRTTRRPRVCAIRRTTSSGWWVRAPRSCRRASASRRSPTSATTPETSALSGMHAATEALKKAQAALRVEVDGKWGPNTEDAILAGPAKEGRAIRSRTAMTGAAPGPSSDALSGRCGSSAVSWRASPSRVITAAVVVSMRRPAVEVRRGD
jgi:hypothetical protein